MKVDRSFQNSTYVKLWDSNEGRKLMTQIVNNPEMIRTNYGFYKQKFQIDPMLTETNADGAATFISRMRKMEMGTMMHMRAPLGDTITKQEANAEYYTGVIPDLISDGFLETAMERKKKEDMFKNEFGGDAFLIEQFTNKLQSLFDSAEMTLSNMAAQILSKGHIVYNFGEGNKGNLYKADIPAENFIKAGEKAWTDPDCKLLDQMKKIEEDFKDKWGAAFNMQWEITYDMFHNVFLKNAQVIDLVKSYRFFNNQVITDNMQVTEEMFRAAIGQYAGGLSPIVIIIEKQNDRVQGIIHGWKDNVAVYRPAGYAGMIRHTENLDSSLFPEYGNNLYSQVYTKAGNGLFTIANIVVPDGRLKQWQTHLMMQAIPSLDEFLYHVIVDTHTADGD